MKKDYAIAGLGLIAFALIAESFMGSHFSPWFALFIGGLNLAFAARLHHLEGMRRLRRANHMEYLRRQERNRG